MEKDELRALEIHRNAIVVEGHSDIMVDVVRRRRRGERHVIRDVFLPRMNEGGVDIAVLTVGGDHSSFVNGTEYPAHTFSTLQAIDAAIMEADESGGECFIVRQKSDLDGRKGIGCILFIEGALPLSGSIHMLRTFHRLGVKMMSFAWSWRNDVADGTAEERSAGLSRLGVEVVREMNRLGMLIDVSHVSDACFDHVLEISEQPVIATHSNARALCDHPRNLTDDMLKKLARKDGVAGICFFPHFLTNNDRATVEDVVNHIDYIRDLIGIDHVSLGPDFLDYRIDFFADSAGSFASVKEGGAKVSQDPATYFRYPEGVEDVRGLPNVTRVMLRRGYSEGEIKKVLGENLLRIYKDVWK